MSGVADIFYDGQDTFQINGWDGDAKKQPSLLDQGTMHAAVREGVTEAPLQHLQTVMLHRFTPHFKPALPLKELLDGIRPQDIEYIAATTDPDVEGIRINYPAEPQKYSKMQVDVFLSAKVNFFATKLIERKEWVMLANDKTGVVEPHVTEVSIEVKEFRDCGGGVWIPVKTEGETRKSGYDGPIMRVVGKVTKLTVNQQLPADALDFQFPENVFVTRLGTDGKVRHAELWKDGKVEREVKSTEELNTLFTAEAARIGKPQPGWRFGYLTIWGGLIGLLVCLAGYRVCRKRA